MYAVFCVFWRVFVSQEKKRKNERWVKSNVHTHHTHMYIHTNTNTPQTHTYLHTKTHTTHYTHTPHTIVYTLFNTHTNAADTSHKHTHARTHTPVPKYRKLGLWAKKKKPPYFGSYSEHFLSCWSPAFINRQWVFNQIANSVRYKASVLIAESAVDKFCR